MLLQRSPTIVHPFEIPIGPLTLTGFGLAVLGAFMISQVIAMRELTRRGHHADARAIPDLILACVIGTLVGGKLYYVTVITRDWSDLFTRAGFVFWGGFIGSVVACWIVVRMKKLSFVRMADVAGLCLAAGYSVGRAGCWAVGDDYGRPWNGPLAVAFPDGVPPTYAGVMERAFGIVPPAGSLPDTLLGVHPTQLYEVAMAGIMFAILWRMRDHKHAEGWLFGVWCILAGIERFIVEFFRAKDDRFVGPLTVAQSIAIAVVLTGVVVVSMRRTSPAVVR
jgi:phosphatidylglycerol:prolipoprotein diacylglycerol transferase